MPPFIMSGLKWFLGFGAKKLLGGFLVAAVSGFLIWAVNDYVDTKVALSQSHELAKQNLEKYQEGQEAWHKERDRLIKDLDAVRKVRDRRTIESGQLMLELEEVRKVIDKTNCGVPPSIARALKLRGFVNE